MLAPLRILSASVVLATQLHLGVLATTSDSTGICPTTNGLPTPPSTCDGSDGVWFPVSVVGRETYCAAGPDICVAHVLGECPGPQVSLPYGSKCALLDGSGVYGCVPKMTCGDDFADSPSDTPGCEQGCQVDTTIPKSCDGSDGWLPVSVVGYGTYCMRGDVCVADNAGGSCPDAQAGLPFGSSCTQIPTGVFGCVANAQCTSACGATNATDLVVCDVEDSSDPSPSSAPPSAAPETPVPSTTAPVTTSPPPQSSSPTPSETPPPTPSATPSPTPPETPSPSLSESPSPTPSDTPSETPAPVEDPGLIVDDTSNLLPVDDTFSLEDISTIGTAGKTRFRH
ncbi:hypothetical protein Poli38472_011289 [Pythium oligandrum]|uniref:Uncharacterized protein n=1 Tax=Pythium oligandrum TaxID=41045 RepID=A0A8K1CR12_PYTOL|nr:hypothetical protein Poli38472_011289 [Pythium oligandrum]|eukprot:TMW67669.1 hypothetical protein Poli38472_011289 [Pythium oligandrum]